jgi:hypothetical protein
MRVSKEFTYNEQKFVGVRKLFGEGEYYLEAEGPDKIIKLKNKIFPNVDDVIDHVKELLKTQETK